MAAAFAPRASLVPSQVHTDTVPGWCHEDIIEVTGDTSYPAGGYAFGTAQLQTMYGGAYSTLISVEVVDNWVSAVPTSFLAVWNKATNKIMAHAQAVAGAAVAQVDVTATTNLSTFACSIRIRFN
jgi:hypothetical protein